MSTENPIDIMASNGGHDHSGSISQTIPLMIRYDGAVDKYSTLWLCTKCFIVCIGDIAAAQHSAKCITKLSTNPPKPACYRVILNK